MVLDDINGVIVKSTLDIGRLTSWKELEFLPFQKESNMKVALKKTICMVMAFILGPMEKNIADGSIKDYSTD